MYVTRGGHYSASFGISSFAILVSFVNLSFHQAWYQAKVEVCAMVVPVIFSRERYKNRMLLQTMRIKCDTREVNCWKICFPIILKYGK